MERFKLTPDHHEHDTGQDLDSGAACATECTGLLHRAPESREEREAAEELTPLEFPPAPRKNTVEPPRMKKDSK